MASKKVVDKVMQFTQVFTGFNFYNYQEVFARRCVESIINHDGDELSMLVARQSGKSTNVACVALGLAVILPILGSIIKDPHLEAFRRGFTVGCYAPEFKQAAIVFNKMRDLLMSKEVTGHLKSMGISMKANRGDAFQFSHGGRVFAKSASIDAKVEGETCNLVILDEAQDLLETKVNKEIRPQVLATGGTIVSLGTVGYRKDHFFNQIQTGLDMERENGGSKRYHFQFDYKMVEQEKNRTYQKTNEQEHLNYGKIVNKEIRRLGGLKMAEQNTEFKMNYMLLWDHSISNFLPLEAEKKIQNTKLQLNPAKVNPIAPFIVGIDLAKERDRTVATGLQVNVRSPLVAPDGETPYYKKDFVCVKEIYGNWETQFPQLCQFINGNNAIFVVVDATGVGSPIVERLMANIPDIHIEPFIFGPRSKDELYRHYADEIMAGRMRIASDNNSTSIYEWQAFMKEHLTAEKEMKGQSFQYLTIRPQLGVHDDYVDSGALACWGAKMYTENFLSKVSVEPNVFRGYNKIQSAESLPDDWPDTPTAKKWKRIREQPTQQELLKQGSWRRTNRRGGTFGR